MILHATSKLIIAKYHSYGQSFIFITFDCAHLFSFEPKKVKMKHNWAAKIHSS